MIDYRRFRHTAENMREIGVRGPLWCWRGLVWTTSAFRVPHDNDA